MSCILYKIENGKAIPEKVKATDVAALLESGYQATPEIEKPATKASKKQPKAE